MEDSNTNTKKVQNKPNKQSSPTRTTLTRSKYPL